MSANRSMIFRRFIRRVLFPCLLVAPMLMMHSASAEDSGTQHIVNVYSYRQIQIMQPLFDLFEEKTGIKVQAVFAGKGLIERIKAEGRNSPADVILTTDISRLLQAAREDVVRAVGSTVLKRDIPGNLRSAEDLWFALSMRARVVYASRARVHQDEITYAQLADKEWKGRLCTRSGQHDYSLGLIASIILHEGMEEAKTWLSAVRDNLARKPSGNDRDQIRRIFSGECDIALGNTYYMGLMETEDQHPEQRDWAKSVKILFPNTKGRGTHVNVSGMAMAKYAPHREDALRFMEFLASVEAQRMYSTLNFEYPVREHMEASDRVKSWGEMKADSLSLEAVGEHHHSASELVDIVQFDYGPRL